MMQAQLLVEALAGDARSTRWGRVVWLLLIVLIAAAGLAGFAVCEWLVVQAALYGWQTANWDRLDFGSLAALPFLFLVVLPLIYAAQPQARPELARPILDALAHGETRLATAAAPQPEPPADLPAGQPVTLRRLRQVTLRNTRWRGMISFLAIIPMELSTLSFALPELVGADSSSVKVLGLSLSDLGLIVAVVSFIGLFLAIGLVAGGSLRRLRVTVDESGISWRRRGVGRRSTAVRWDEVRGFYRVGYLASSASLRTMYIVDAGDRVFAWAIGSAARAAQLGESERLAGIICQRTRLPLRDISELVVKARQYRRRPDELGRLGLTPDAVAALRRLGHRSLRWLWFGLPCLLIFTIAFLVALVGAQRLEDYQRSYFASLPQKVHAEAAIFYDPLTVFDNRWDVERPSKDNGNVSLGYRGGTYQMTGRSGCYVYSYADPVYSDAAVEVTAAQRGKAADGDDGVGIMLRADTDEDMVVFAVSPTSGSWWLSHHLYNPEHPNDSWLDMDSGTSAFVRTGAGASNTLLIIARGPTYLLYVNGHFLDAYTDRYHEDPNLPIVGNAGLYVNDGAATGIFTNFNVYPVQSPPSLSYV